MPYSVVWSPKALRSYSQVLEYLQENWTEKEKLNFINRTELVLFNISQNPSLYPYLATHIAYKAIITKQVSLLYHLKGTSVELLMFWDNRQNPDKLNKFIE